MDYRNGGKQVTFCKFHLKPLIILRLLLIKEGLSWEVYVADHAVLCQCARFPSSVNSENLLNLTNAVSCTSICHGNFAYGYIAMVRMKKGFSHHNVEKLWITYINLFAWWSVESSTV